MSRFAQKIHHFQMSTPWGGDSSFKYNFARNCKTQICTGVIFYSPSPLWGGVGSILKRIFLGIARNVQIHSGSHV